MKVLKKILITILSLIILLVISVFIIFGIDNNKTNYLSIEKHASFHKTSYAITNVNVIPMSKDTVLANQTVIIKNGLIDKIGPEISANNYEIVDAKGKFLSPGLIDMHVHVWDKYEFGLYLANGVTSVRNMWGIPYHLRLKEDINNQDFLAPQFIIASPKLTGPNDSGIDKLQVSTPEEGKQLVKKFKADGYDLIKTYAGMPKNIFDAIIEQVRIENMPIGAHPSYEVDYSYHFKPEIVTIEHTEEIVQEALKFQHDSIKTKHIINLYANNDAAHTPTLSIFQNIIDIIEQGENILNGEDVSYMNPMFVKLGSMNDYNRWTSEQQYNPETLKRIKDQHVWHLQLVKQLSDAGVTLVCGSDSGIMFAKPGFSTHEELSLYKEAGLSSFEALSTATINPSKVSQFFKNVGSVEEGKTANLILSNENPLENLNTLKTPEMVWVNGRMINKRDMTDFKNKAKNRTNGAATLIRIVESLL